MKLLQLALSAFLIIPTLSISADEARYIHIIVALADNESQGIVPIPKLIGNGDDPRNNLYWGALYGFKTQFKKNKNWKLLNTKKKLSEHILEQVLFYNKKHNTYLIGDAYKGSSIKEATQQFLIATSSSQSEALTFKGKNIKTYGQADLIGYVGHNGLMDFNIKKEAIPVAKKGNNDAIILACQSKLFFTNWLTYTGANSLLLTTGNMAPEAYTLEAALEAWMKKKPNSQIKESAAKAYNKYQKTGIKGARRLFFTQE